MSDATKILNAAKDGPVAAEELLPLVYQELRRLAQFKMSHLPPGQTLQATALVHEAFLKLIHSPAQHWENRAHFYSAAAEAMRHLLIDRARRKASRKHGSGKLHIDIDQVDVAAESNEETLLAVNEAIEGLEKVDARAAEFVKMRYFVGLKHAEIANMLGMSERSSKRLWTFARAWLLKELQGTY